MCCRLGLAFVCIATLPVAGCYCSHVPDSTDAGADARVIADAQQIADARVRVTGCDDPRVWSAAAPAELRPSIGGGPCSPAQYPLHLAGLTWWAPGGLSAEERARLTRSCWRVVEADERSGWTAGDVFAAESPYPAASLMGFERAVTFEGRVLRDDGTLVVAVEPGTVALDPARAVAERIEGVVAVMTQDAWAERDAVHLGGESVRTQEIVGGTSTLVGGPVTLHRAAGELTLRFWSRAGGAIDSTDVPLGAGERALLASGGTAVAIDDALLLIGGDGPGVQHTLPLPAPPAVLVGRYHYVVAQVPGSLIRVDRGTGETRSMDVGPGVLLSTEGDSAPVFFDGSSFVPLDVSAGALSFDERRRVRPSAAQIEALGAPLSVQHGVVLGEHGFLLALDEASPVPGPRFASVAELFGEGRLVLVGGDGVTYAIEHADGTTSLYVAPYVDFCE